jgi:two-component system NtrC family sensor kinase
MPSPAFPLRRKLTLAALAPLVAAVALCSLVGISIINSRIVSQAQDRVRTDLNSAREIYQREVGRIRDVIRFSAATPLAARAVTGNDRSLLAPLMAPLLHGEGLDLVTVVNSRGVVIYRAHNPDSRGDDRAVSPLVAPPLKGQIVAGTALFNEEELAAESGQLAERARIHLVATPRARATSATMERAGMALVAAAPVRDGAGRVVGAIYGGVLLNRNNTLVDRIRQIVYEGVRFDGQEVGSATLFLGDTRIATNVMTLAGERALGTRMSQEVRERVVEKGERWISRAFVVNDWYFSAYEPIRGLRGETVGALYVGMLEKPYAALKRNITLAFAGVLLAGTLLGVVLSNWLGSHLARPIREFERLARRIAAGERGITITVESRDEIGALADEFNAMTRALTEREQEIGELNRGLERKVQERTAQLEEKNLQLLKAREELVRAEKLADLGTLSAGVAHEINNPLAIIRGNAELLQMSLPVEGDDAEEVETILEQTRRVERIVANLLTFARQGRKQVSRFDPGPLLEEILRQVGHQVPLTGIGVQLSLEPALPAMEGDEGQLRQVFTNLVVNGIQAMPQGGTLSVAARHDTEHETLQVTVADSGAGMDQAAREQVFTPFFTTKASGTGLGLSVSYGIVREHGGTITVESAPGAGTRFLVTLPLRQG